MKKVKLTDKQVSKLQNVNLNKAKAFNDVSNIVNKANIYENSWWDDVYKFHDLDPESNYEIEGKDGNLYLKESKFTKEL